LLPVTLSYREDDEIVWEKPQSLKENAKIVSAQRKIHVKVFIHDPVGIHDYQGKSASQICKMVEHTVLEPLGREHVKN
jgi:hypothetical protein